MKIETDTDTAIKALRYHKKEIILALSTTLVLGLLGSMGLEYYYRQISWHDINTRFDSELGWITIPSKTVTQKEITYSHNSMGFRSPKIKTSLPKILLVGDSTTYGLGVNNNQTISSFLDQYLPRFQVLNLGISGYGPDQYYLYLRRVLPKLNADLIVSIYLEETILIIYFMIVLMGKVNPFIQCPMRKFPFHLGKSLVIHAPTLFLNSGFLTDYFQKNG